MKLPDNINKVTIESQLFPSVFPPNGFMEIEEGNDGGGDGYGLYWEIGRETEEPIVCLRNHEEFLLIPEFPGLDSFLSWYYVEQGYPVNFATSSEKLFFVNLYNKPRVLTKNGKTEDAIRILEESIELFSEFTDAWTLLAENYHKLHQVDKAENASLNSIITNYAFGLPSRKAIDQFNKINPSGKLRNHPLIKRKEGLLSGGNHATPFTINYQSILAAVAELEKMLDYRAALILEQNYAYLISFEKMEIREKHNFNPSTWGDNFKHKVLIFFPERR